MTAERLIFIALVGGAFLLVAVLVVVVVWPALAPFRSDGGVVSTIARHQLAWPSLVPGNSANSCPVAGKAWLRPRFELVIPPLFWARLVRGAAVHGLRSPGSAFGFGIEIHRLRRSHPSIP